jgi:hypothetical protein
MAGPSFTETRVSLILSFLARFSSRDLDNFDEELLLSLSLSPLLLLSLLEGLRLLLLLRVGKVASYADVVRGTHRNGSDVADVMRQPVVNGRM